ARAFPIGDSSQPVWLLSFVSHHTSPKARGPPDARTQAFQLDDLTVIHEEVHFGTPVLDVPSENLRIGRLEHHFLQAERVDDASALKRVCGAELTPCGAAFGHLPAECAPERTAQALPVRRESPPPAHTADCGRLAPWW